MFNIINTTKTSTFDPINYVKSRMEKPMVQEEIIPAQPPQGHFEYSDMNRLSQIVNAIGEQESFLLQDSAGNYYKPKTKEERYAYQNPYSQAIGYYQVEPKTLKDLAPKYLGRNVTVEEFRKNPNLQDQLIRNTMKAWLSDKYTSTGKKYRLTEEEAIKAWNIGMKGLTDQLTDEKKRKKADDYLNNVYRFLPKQEEKKPEWKELQPVNKKKKEEKKPNVVVGAIANLIKKMSTKDETV